MKNKYIFFLAAVICAILAVSATAHAEGDANILTKNSVQTKELDTFNYLLYTPENAAENMPLIVYLHGGSGKGDDLDNITSVEGFPQYVNDGVIRNIPAYIIFPQVPSSKKGWAEIKNSVKELIDCICETYNIDETRISLTGHSMGGTGTWNIALAFPQTFSAIAPLSGSIKSTEDNINKLSNTPVWAFVGSADTIVDPASSSEFIAALKEKNPYAEITVFDGATHFDVPGLTYLDGESDVVKWLIGNARENTIIGFSAGKVSVKTEVPGTYTVLFADYDENGILNDVEILTRVFEFGKTEIAVPSDISLDTNDRIMLWDNLSNVQPLCQTYKL